MAEQAKVSRRKAEQAAMVAKHAPEPVDEIARGEMKLLEAANQVKTRREASSTARPPKPRSYNVKNKAAVHMRKTTALIAGCPVERRPELKELLLRDCKRLCER
jgi:hypothetical protein